jgi:hypothetical protein
MAFENNRKVPRLLFRSRLLNKDFYHQKMVCIQHKQEVEKKKKKEGMHMKLVSSINSKSK